MTVEDPTGWINEYAKQHKHDSSIRVDCTPEKGRILLAARDFDPGVTIIAEPPLHLAQVEAGAAVWRALNEFHETHHFTLEPIWYWAAINSIFTTDEGFQKWEQRYGEATGVKRLAPEVQRRLLALYVPKIRKASRETKYLVAALELRKFIEPLQFEKLLQVWVHNCFEYSDEPLGYVTYFMPSFASHSCAPNAVWSCDDDGIFVLTARTRIKAEEELTITYLSEETLHEPAYRRQRTLQSTKGFRCTCVRCTAPADLSRGFRCPSCRMGTIFLHPDTGVPGRSRAPTAGPPTDIRIVDESPTSDPGEIGRRVAGVPGNMCLGCDHTVTSDEVQEMLSEERHFFKYLRSRSRGPEDFDGTEDSDASPPKQPDAGEGELGAAGEEEVQHRLEETFTQHYVLTKWLQSERDRFERDRNFARMAECSREKLKLYRRMYPALTGSVAWVRENLADQILESRQISTPRNTLGAILPPSEVDDLLKPDNEVVSLYREAYRILNVLFGDRHGYLQDIRQKVGRLQDFLTLATGEDQQIDISS